MVNKKCQILPNFIDVFGCYVKKCMKMKPDIIKTILETCFAFFNGS